MSLPEAIVQQAKALPEGGMLSPKEFLHLGSRAAVDQAFSRQPALLDGRGHRSGSGKRLKRLG